MKNTISPTALQNEFRVLRPRRLRLARKCVVLCVVGLTLAMAAGHCRADALARMTPEWLKQTHEAVETLAQDRQEVSLKTEYQDFRACMHVHSLLSHDSRGTIKEIRENAKRAGVKIIMFTDHPSEKHDYIDDSHRGLDDGVLFIPGAEQRGLQSYPLKSIQKEPTPSPQAQVDLVRGTKGQVFLCHLEERMDWELDGLTGSEIYNIHADFKDELPMIKALRSPVGMLRLAPLIKQYPQETFAALQNYPADYLKRYDELCLKSRLTGVSANDAHHNQGVHAFVGKDGKVQLEGALGEKMAQLDPEKVPLMKPLLLGKSPGDTIFRMDLDPYERSFRHVSTHLFLKEQTEANVRECLDAGRAYVAFDWLADPTGFVFQAATPKQTWEMGSEPPFDSALELRAEAPMPGTFRILRNGKEVISTRSRSIKHTVTEPGNYRVEVWLNLPDEPKIWILSNPIYVRDAEQTPKS
ncbi:MAG: hypothetical protein WD648_10435 [Planctomycetaceae bacterium]